MRLIQLTHLDTNTVLTPLLRGTLLTLHHKLAMLIHLRIPQEVMVVMLGLRALHRLLLTQLKLAVSRPLLDLLMTRP